MENEYITYEIDLKCAHCDYINDHGDRDCQMCGAPLSSEKRKFEERFNKSFNERYGSSVAMTYASSSLSTAAMINDNFDVVFR